MACDLSEACYHLIKEFQGRKEAFKKRDRINVFKNLYTTVDLYIASSSNFIELQTNITSKNEEEGNDV